MCDAAREESGETGVGPPPPPIRTEDLMDIGIVLTYGISVLSVYIDTVLAVES